MHAFLLIVEVIVKCLIGIVTGAGAGALVFGIGLFWYGAEDFGRFGPPPGPAFIGIGVGLLTSAAAMMALFYGPLSRRRWFRDVEASDSGLKKWKQAG